MPEVLAGTWYSSGLKFGFGPLKFGSGATLHAGFAVRVYRVVSRGLAEA